MKILRIMFMVLFAIVFRPLPSAAHKINLFVWTENDTITVESTLSGGRTLVNGAVAVVDTSSGKTVVSGETDASGTFSFSLPEEVAGQSPPLDIIVSAGDGHQAHWLLAGSDYGSAAETLASRPQPEKRLPTQTADDGDRSCLSRAEFEQLLDTHLEQKLAPIRKIISRPDNPSPSIRDIGAGIGYLLGSAGLIAWFRNRRQNKGNTTKGEQ